MLRFSTVFRSRWLAQRPFPNGDQFRPSYSTEALASGYRPDEVERAQQPNVVPQTVESRPDRPKYSFILPPPNVTGNLHLGHALMSTVQDVIARHRRRHADGNDVCWIPGTDHAGIATQVIVERHLRAQLGVGRHQLGRQRFIDEVWRWRDRHAHRIRDDLQRLGAGAAWQREFFTMDERRSRAVREAFVRLFDDGLVYRGDQLVNWSCALESTISDIEVDTVQVLGRTPMVVPGYERPVLFGELTEVAYTLCNDNIADSAVSPATELGEIVVATTRPETVLGDVAIAVHPDDPRYERLRCVQRPRVWHPLRRCEIPVVFDAAVDPEFGTGAVKITPAHDRFDFELARRHGLDTGVAVIDERGAICGGFDADAGIAIGGCGRFDARERIRDRLADLGRLRSIREHAMQLPVCSRSGDIVELLLRPQWFVRCAEMAEGARQAVETGELRIVPEQFEAEWHRWLAEPRDWCVSRQLWWGHRVPAYECSSVDGAKVWVAAHDEQQARAKAMAHFGGSDPNGIDVRQDADVLDTWFSSGLLPFSALDWPDADPNGDLQRYYPHDLLVTGHDILFFWVARMVMLGMRLTGRVPFKTVLLHGLVCDANGRKMSKSLGNVVTPAQVMDGITLADLHADTDAACAAGTLTTDEANRSKKDQTKLYPNGIPACGTDALRFTLCSHNLKSHFIAFDVHECHTNKLFFNKIWQATRFTLAARSKWSVHLAPDNAIESGIDVQHASAMDRWILSRLARTVGTVDTAIGDFQLHVATAALRTFFYQNLCDVYVETTKTGLSSADWRRARTHCAVLTLCLSRGLDELAAFAPFVSSELQQHIGQPAGGVSHFEPERWLDDELEQSVGEMLAICAAIRQLKSERNITRKHQPMVHIHISDAALLQRLRSHHADDIRTLTHSVGVQLSDRPLNEDDGSRSIVAQSTAGVHCTFGIEVGPDVVHQFQRSNSAESVNPASLSVNERKRLKMEQDLQRLESTVANEGFRRAASVRVQEQHREKIERIRTELARIKQMSG